MDEVEDMSRLSSAIHRRFNSAASVPHSFAQLRRQTNGSAARMRNQLLGASLMMALIAFPVATYAQSGAATGAAAGAAAGGAAGGPAGAAVGAGVGAVAGGLSDANRPKFRQYVTTQK